MVATVLTAGMTLTVLVVVMVTACIGIIVELALKICDYRHIRIALYSAEEFYTCFVESILSSAADTAADKYVNAVFL